MKWWCRACNDTTDFIGYDKSCSCEDGYYCLYCDSCDVTINIQTGAPVQLTAGGPAMTIQKIKNNVAFCIWFDNNQKMKEASFPISTLTFADFGSDKSADNDDEEDEYDDDDYYDDDDDDYY